MKLDLCWDVSFADFKTHTPSPASQMLPLYVEQAGHLIAGKDYFTDRSELPNYIIFQVLSGCAYVRLHGVEYHVHPNQMVMLNCNKPHYYGTYGDSLEKKWAHISGSAVPDFFRRINGGALTVLTMPDPQACGEMLDALHDTIRTNDALVDIRNFKILSALLCDMVIAAKQSSAQMNRYAEDIKRVMDYIDAHLSEPIALDDLSKSVPLSKYHFIRVFKECTGLPPHQYITRRRIGLAQDALVGTTASIAEICAQSGFRDHNSFTLAFRRLTGMTPATYRKQRQLMR